MCTTPNLHGNSSLSQPHGPLLAVHKGVHACITQLLNGLPSGKGASRKLERVWLLEDVLRAFDALKQACMSTPILAFALIIPKNSY